MPNRSIEVGALDPVRTLMAGGDRGNDATGYRPDRARVRAVLATLENELRRTPSEVSPGEVKNL
ncbi:hypothetical protein AB0I81_57610 [Nonomuraea sp. NPDC050404]|uniref:hypothetical protein n=1 Tax=Nonomuraea sp. NPDC050404 TaxID=3155783 RepID=UPI0033FCF924